MTLWTLSRGESPLVIDVPHAGTVVPDAMAARLTDAARAVPDTDWHVEKLYDFAREAGATLLAATHSRFVVDLNRDPGGAAPGATEVSARIDAYFTPYHEALHAEIDRVRARHGHAVLLDGHSIRAQVPRFFAGQLPDLNLGTADGASTDRGLQDRAAALLAGDRRFTSIVNGRFKGGWITRRYGRPREGVHALQLEMAQSAYMDESPPYRWDAVRAAPLAAVLRRLVSVLSDWRPGA